jgi:hypothetical protein
MSGKLTLNIEAIEEWQWMRLVLAGARIDQDWPPSILKIQLWISRSQV